MSKNGFIKIVGAALFAFIVAAALLGFGFFQGRRLGYHEGSAAVRDAAFVNTFAALRELESKKVEKATDRLQAFCYSTACDLINYPTRRTANTMLWYSNDLSQYLTRNRHSPEQSYVTERKLGELLTRHQQE
jgi:hypothetical protein